MEENGNLLMEKYQIGRQLGKGNFAKVYYGRNLKSGKSVAIKVIDKEKVLKVGLLNQTKREISVMALLEHPNILKLHEVLATKKKIYFILDYAKGGELYHKVAKGKLTEDTALSYFQQLISAIDFCHRRGVYHRDLKPENILLDENGILKVSDFGLSALAECKRKDGLLHTTCGTPAYVAPEIISRKGYDGAKADVWSCGVILFVLLAGYLPFHDNNLMEMYRKISIAMYKCPKWFPSEARTLLSRMLDPNPHTRISISSVMQNPWFKKVIVENKKLTNTNTNTNTNTITDVRQEMGKPCDLNAFDIISLSKGLDLSGLFVEKYEKEEVQFTSARPANVIISNLEEIFGQVSLKMTKKDEGLLKFERVNYGRNGPLCIEVEIYVIAPVFHLVVLKKCGGDRLEYVQILNERIRPALGDVVWAWQGERQHETGSLSTNGASCSKIRKLLV